MEHPITMAWPFHAMRGFLSKWSKLEGLPGGALALGSISHTPGLAQLAGITGLGLRFASHPFIARN
jgi:hypothetical protein